MTQADQYRQLLNGGMSPLYAREMMEFATGRWKGDGYLPRPGEDYDPDPFGVGRMTEEEYIAFLETQDALPEDTPDDASQTPVPTGAGAPGRR